MLDRHHCLTYPMFVRSLSPSERRVGWRATAAERPFPIHVPATATERRAVCIAMVLMIPRAAAALARGYLNRRAGSLVPGAGFSVPHVMRTRCGLLDVDSFGHMNNAAYFTHCELARWQLIAEVGALTVMQRERLIFLVGSTVTRFRREVQPFQPFEVHTQMLGWDERSMVYEHNIKLSADSPPLSQTLCRAVIKSKGKLVSPEDFFAAMGLPPELVESRRGTMEGNETVAAFAALDAAQKASAAAA